MKVRHAMIAAAVALAATGCTRKSALYHWGSYDDSLYQHYKHPQDREAWVESLRTNILHAEQRGLKVPPGMYAEFGYALYEEGAMKEAVVYFQKEQEQWPESRFLMDKMIRNAERRTAPNAKTPTRAPAATHGPATKLEKTR